MLQDTIRYAYRIRDFLKDIDFSEKVFMADLKTQGAIMHSLIVIGEALGRLENYDEFSRLHPDLPYRAAKNMRNILTHDYGKVALDAVWRVATQRTPELQRLAEHILSEDFGIQPDYPKSKHPAQLKTPSLKNDIKAAKDAAHALGRRESRHPPRQGRHIQ